MQLPTIIHHISTNGFAFSRYGKRSIHIYSDGVGGACMMHSTALVKVINSTF